MFKNEINFISDLNLNKIQFLGEKFTIDEIKRSKIHPAIFQYISANIDYEIFSDRKKIENDSICDYSSDRINNYFLLIAEEIKRTQKFNIDYIKRVLQNAIVFNIKYLTQPNKTLTNLIFGNSKVKSLEEIVVGLSHAYYYRFLKKILLTYLDKKKVLLMSKNEFTTLLNRIDEISKETHLEDTLKTAVNSITNFFDQNSKNAEKLPVLAVKMYLEEKGLQEFVSKLENKFGPENLGIFVANDIIHELRSVTPESEIEIQQTGNIEDSLLVDHSENINDTNIENKGELVDDLPIIKEVDDGSQTHLVDAEEFLEVDEVDVEIPNHEILSSNENLEQNEDNIIELAENSDEVEENAIESLENIEEFVDEKDTLSQDKLSEDTADENVEIEEDSKKKNNAVKLLDDLIDLDPVYDSLLPPIVSFAETENRFDYNDQIEKPSEEINYQLDLSTIKEEIDLKSNNTLSVDQIDEVVEKENNQIDDSIQSADVEDIDEKIPDLEQLIDGNHVDINSTIDDVVNQDLTEHEFLTENKVSEEINYDVEETQNFDNIIPDNKLVLDDEEITEVFTDLAYLDKDGNTEEPILSEKDQEKSSEEILEEERSEDVSNHENFSQMLSTKDMTKIIEVLFDYDMEDYHTLVDKVSNSTSEQEAFQITTEYCNNNNIEPTVNEVEIFKSMILEYFSQTYS